MRTLLLALVVCLVAGCVMVFQSAEVTPLAVAPPDIQDGKAFDVESPLRVHLLDGSTALFPLGAMVRADSIWGVSGELVSFPDGSSRPISGVQMEQVVGAEVYSTEVNEVKTLLATAGATIVGIYAAAAAAVVIFGSCPTVYSATPADTLALEAELFSNSIAPLFEMRDRDVLRYAHPEDDGTVRLEIRNEALESHYINHLALEAISHASDARAVPADNGYAHVLANELAPISATDRVGRDVLAPLHQLDGTAYATADEVTAGVTEDDLTDTVTLTFPHPGTDSAAVALRFRSSLLTTVLLYEHMLAGQGAEALDWIGQDMASIGSVVELGEYYLRRLGLRIEIEENGAFREVGRIAEAGPIAWAERAVVVPVPEGDVLRVRLRFLADGWRIDRATLATDVQTHPTQTVPLARATLDDGQRMTRVETQLARPDQAYALQQPGHVFQAVFEPPPPARGQSRSLFVSAQGYYIEWMRPDWLRQQASQPFHPTDSTLVAAVRTWQDVRDLYESEFHSSMLPVR